MFDDVSSTSVMNEAQNAPNLSFAATPILGNTQFQIDAPPTKGTVQPGFPTVPYQSIESLLFFQNMSNPNNAPYTNLGGATSGQQNISGQFTIKDNYGNTQMVMGNQTNGFS